MVLPGTLYLVQGGQLYSYSGGNFIALHPGPGQWSQPSVDKAGSQLAAVNRGAEWSDIVLLGLDGKVVRALTTNQRSAQNLDLNHWAFYPRFTADGKLLYSYDSPKFGFRVDLAIWQLTLGRAQSTALRRTLPFDYTGGDVFPNPLAGGGLLYAKYKSDVGGMILSQLWLQSGLQTAGTELTPPEQDCGQPALSPDGARVAMVCTGGKQAGQLEVASFDGQKLGPPVTWRRARRRCRRGRPTARRLPTWRLVSPRVGSSWWVVDAGGAAWPGSPPPGHRQPGLRRNLAAPPGVNRVMARRAGLRLLLLVCLAAGTVALGGASLPLPPPVSSPLPTPSAAPTPTATPGLVPTGARPRQPARWAPPVPAGGLLGGLRPH